MRPLAFLHYVAKAVLKGGANLVGLGEIVEQVWNDWIKDKDEAARKAELQALVQMAGDRGERFSGPLLLEFSMTLEE